MMRTLLRWGSMGLAASSMIVVIVGFYMPWASVDLHKPDVVQQLEDTLPVRGMLQGLKEDVGRIAVTVKRGAETVTGDLPNLSDFPKQVTGAQIPQMVNEERAKVAAALVELLTNTRQHLGLKSYAVYVVPGFALLAGALLLGLGHRAPVAWGVAVVCGGIAGLGFWKLLTTNMQTLFVAITIGPGLWLSLWAYTGLAAAALIDTFSRRHL